MDYESAAYILRESRLSAAMTQTDVAKRAGLAQSVVSAYESGRREPSLETLRRLVGATGFDLDIRRLPSEPRSPLQTKVDLHRTEVRRALLRLGAKSIRLFGSVARGEDTSESDIDLLVEVRPSVGLFALGQMRSEAERILGNTVDVVLADGLKPDLSESVLAEAIPL